MDTSFIAQEVARLRANTPLVHCIINSVVTGFTANVLLASGAAPAMVDCAGEAGPFARVASALLINVGTPSIEQRAATFEAVQSAREAGTPWVLDPVGVGAALPVRTQECATLIGLRPTVIRGNASEILTLAGISEGGRGMESADSVEVAQEAARSLAQSSGAVVAVSGPVDYLTDGQREFSVANGSTFFTQVTGSGCALGTLMAAFQAGSADLLLSAVAANVFYTVAGEKAATQAAGPGSFAVALLDNLCALSPEEALKAARVS
ncbi:MAG: hydroxyethylthiazole kinase [Actinomycetaceae bacterium]|nr:hydroxyethylthiazole kinase [Actinomycetaceae bacterium]